MTDTPTSRHGGDRVAEALQVAAEPAKFKKFPAWTQRVMEILKEQFVPREFAAVLAGDASVFAEGIAVALEERFLATEAETGSGSPPIAVSAKPRSARAPGWLSII